ncbi:hypothetical protein [Streptomyces sp. CB03911]|uniref:hypothetical protein n=1 Tax=Streptomyces sp. CB03911 TaxID=1804758 RepID=UPI0018FE4415|nr:hypothetical protein [Streptomyces sp. CB03911]
MRTPESRRERTRTGLLGASASLLLGMVAHVTAGGDLPGPGVLGGLFAALLAVGVLLPGTRDRRSFRSTVSVLAAAQFALHLALDRLSMPARHAALTSASATDHVPATGAFLCTSDGLSVVPDAMQMPADMDMGFGPGVIPGPVGGAVDAATVAGPMPHGMGWAMTAAHALATFGTAVFLLHGDRVLRRLATLVVRRLILPLLRCPAPERPRVPACDAPSVRLHAVLLARCVPRRGPPTAAWA